MIAFAFLGPIEGTRSIASGFAQIIDGALHPSLVGVELLSRLAALNASPLLLAGIVAAKSVSLSLLPAPVLPGGKWLIVIWDPNGETKVVELLTIVTSIALIGLNFSWFMACVLFLWRT